MKLFGAAALLAIGALAFWQSTAMAATSGPERDDLAKPHPEAVIGRLPNGLRYTILQHPSHNKESIQLFVDAGSRDESDPQRGVAHFIEHMAFIGPKGSAAADLPRQFGRAGIAWGRDQNAFTTYFGTTFTLNIPEVSDAKLDVVFKWLGDVAGGLVFDPDGVDKERGVVLQEYIRGLGPAHDVNQKTQLFSGPNLRGPLRPAIGTEATIKGLNTADLTWFYAQWYRPENTIIAVVGDEPTDVMKKRIEATFGGWVSKTPVVPRFGPGSLDHARASEALTVTEPKLPTSVSICRYTDKDPVRPEGVISHRATLADQIWSAAFARRFQALARSNTPPFLGASAGRAEAYHTIAQVCFAAGVINDDWKLALKHIAEEVRRMELYGVTQQEVDLAKSQITQTLNQVVASEPTRDAAPLATNILYNYQENGTFDSAEEDRRVQLKALAQLDVKSVSDAFRRRWNSADQPLFTVISPTPVAATDVRTAWQLDLASAPPAAPIDQPKAVWGYSTFGPKGEVVRRETLSDPDFVRLTFKNGVIVNFKQTSFAKSQVDIRVRFGAGQQEIEPGHAWAAGVGAGTLLEGGLGKNTVEDVTDICRSHACRYALSVGRTAFEFSGVTRPDDLGLELQLITALLSDPAFRGTQDKRMPSIVHAVYRQIDSNPMAVAGLAFSNAMQGPRIADLPAEKDAAALKTDDFKKLLQDPLENDALEVTIVGDVAESQAVDAIASTLGSLKARPRIDHTRPDAAHVVFPVITPQRIVAPHKGPQDKAAIIMTWPLYVWSEDRIHEGRVLSLLTGVLKDKIIDRVRRKLGQSYAPNVGLSVQRGGDRGSLTVAIETSPKDVDAVISEVQQIAADCAAGKITSESVEPVRKLVIDADAQQRSYNGWWLGVMDGSFEHPEGLISTRTHDRDMAAITLQEVKSEARQWLTSTPVTVVSLPESPH